MFITSLTTTTPALHVQYGIQCPEYTRLHLRFSISKIFPEEHAPETPKKSAPFTVLMLSRPYCHCIECFHSRDHYLCKFIGTKESVCIRKEFNSHRTGLGHQHGRRFIVLGHQYGRRDVMWKHSILYLWDTSITKSSLKHMTFSFPCPWRKALRFL